MFATSCASSRVQVPAATPDAAALAQLLLHPTTTLPAARLLRPHLPAAVRALANQLASTRRTHATTVALMRVLHIAPHLLDTAMPWFASQPPPWQGLSSDDAQPQHSMQPADVLLASLHALQAMPRLLQAWSPAGLPPLLAPGNDGVLRWAALQCLGVYARMSDATMRYLQSLLMG